MAEQKRKSRVDYKQLNAVSSVVLYDTAPSKYSRKRGKFFEVERIISQRKLRSDYEYLIKWRGWPLESCSWEETCNLTTDLLRNYENPVKVSDERLEAACREFTCGSLSALKSPSLSPVYINLDLDIWHYATYRRGTASKHQGHFLFSKQDLCRLKYLPIHWWYYMNEHGEGMAVDFPLKIKAVLSWSPVHYYINQGHVGKAARFPLEKICVNIAKRPCNIKNLSECIEY